MLCEIISGPTEGVERAGFEVAKENGLSTGGRFSSDATIYFTRRPYSVESAKIRNETESARRPYYEVNITPRNQFLPTNDVACWLVAHKVGVLTIAGDAEHTSPGIKDQVKTFLREVLQELAIRGGLVGNSQDTADCLTKLRIPNILCEIISGLTDGAELAALELAKEQGVTTGGCFSVGINRTQRRLAEHFGLFEDRDLRRQGEKYKILYDATIYFTRSQDLQSSDFIYDAWATACKPICKVIINTQDRACSPVTVAAWLIENNISVLNVAGGTEEEIPGIKRYVKTFLNEMLEELRKKGKRFDNPPDGRIWLARYHAFRRNKSRAYRAYTSFVDDPSEETLQPLLDNALSRILDVYKSLQSRERGEVRADDQIHYLKTCYDCYEHLKTVLGGFVCSPTGMSAKRKKSLTDGYRTLEKSQDFDYYATALSLFFLLKSATNADDRTYFATLLLHCFEPHLQRYISQERRQSNNRFEEYIQDESMRVFLDENTGYLVKDQEISFGSLLRGLEKRLVDWRSRSVQKSKAVVNRRDFGSLETHFDRDFDARSNGLFRFNNAVSDRDLMSSEKLNETKLQEREICQRLAEKFFTAACNAAGKFNNNKGRRLLLLMMLGGLSHKKKCAARRSCQSTKYLVQPELISEFLNEDSNFIDHWFQRELSGGIDFVAILGREKKILKLETLDHSQSGWRVFVHLSDFVVNRIQLGILCPDSRGIHASRWPIKFNQALTSSYSDNEVEQRQFVIASFTKFVCEMEVVAQSRWIYLLEEFAKI